MLIDDIIEYTEIDQCNASKSNIHDAITGLTDDELFNIILNYDRNFMD